MTDDPVAAGSDGSAGGWDPIEDSEPRTRTRSQASDRVAIELDRDVLVKIMRGLVLAVSQGLHTRLARKDDQVEAELWLADASEQSAIGDPLAQIGIRRVGPTAPSADIANLIESGVAFATYVTTNAAKAWELRRARRALARALPDFTEHPAG